MVVLQKEHSPYFICVIYFVHSTVTANKILQIIVKMLDFEQLTTPKKGQP